MQTHCKILLVVIICVLCSIENVFCAALKRLTIEDLDGMDHGSLVILASHPHEKIENHTPTNTPGVWLDQYGNRYSLRNDKDIPHYGSLSAHGDYSKLKLIIRSVRKDYKPGELIIVKFFVRNDSDNEVHIRGSFSATIFFHLWKLFNSDGEAVKTPKGVKLFRERKEVRTSDKYRFNIMLNTGFRYIKLQPGQEYELDSVHLNDYFNLSKPDSYELTYFHPTFIKGQYYDPPLQSNTLTFRVLEEGEKSGVVEVDTNPPKGEEVFKQPKPPKNVFYALDRAGNEVFLDESPTTMAHRWAKERKAQTDQPEE